MLRRGRGGGEKAQIMVPHWPAQEEKEGKGKKEGRGSGRQAAADLILYAPGKKRKERRGGAKGYKPFSQDLALNMQ